MPTRLLTCLICFLTFIVAGCGSRVSSKLNTPEKFEKAVLGKTPDQVLKILGRPAMRFNPQTADESWLYERAVIDPITRKRVNMQVIFKFREVTDARIF